MTQYEKKLYLGIKLHNALPPAAGSQKEKDLGLALHKWLINHPLYTIEGFFKEVLNYI